VTSPRDCLACDGSGYLPVYAEHLCQSVAMQCPSCNGGDITPHIYRDEDHDGWLDYAARVPARFHGGLQPRRVDTVVLHRLQNGWHGAGPRYVASPDRVVSWHFTVHRPGWERSLSQHLPIARVAYHARAHNQGSVGIECDGPHDAPWAPGTVDEVVLLLDSLRSLCPGLSTVVSHRHLSPDRRTDPEGFPWEALDGMGIEVLP